MMRVALMALLRAYRAVISPLYGQVCKYHPSCSAYALEAVDRHGAARGTWLAARRVLRCNPFSHGGYDPVPPARLRGPVPAADPDPREAPALNRPRMSDDGVGYAGADAPPATGHVGPDAVPPISSAVPVTALAGEARP